MAATDFIFGTVLFTLVGIISLIDLREMLIPDWANLALLGAGLVWQAVTHQQWPWASLAFAGGMFAGFWLLRLSHWRLRRAVGLGQGDVKMAGAAACWFSPWNTPLFLMAGSVSALIFVAALVLRGRAPDLQTRVPFGPFLGIGLLVTWLLERSGLPTFIPYGVS